MKNNFTKKDIGSSVVFAGFNGGSYSARITDVSREYVVIEYYPVYAQCHTAWVLRGEWNRLTCFPEGCNFLAIA